MTAHAQRKALAALGAKSVDLTNRATTKFEPAINLKAEVRHYPNQPLINVMVKEIH
jgi:hypothetical protein